LGVLDHRNKWFFSKYGHIFFGVESDRWLKDCFGVWISPTENGEVILSRFDKDGGWTTPRISFTTKNGLEEF